MPSTNSMQKTLAAIIVVFGPVWSSPPKKLQLDTWVAMPRGIHSIEEPLSCTVDVHFYSRVFVYHWWEAQYANGVLCFQVSGEHRGCRAAGDSGAEQSRPGAGRGMQ